MTYENLWKYSVYTCAENYQNKERFHKDIARNIFDSMKNYLLSALCSIDVLAYGATSNNTPQYGHVKLNTVPVWLGSWLGRYHRFRRGVYIVLVDHFRCSVREIREFDTFGKLNDTINLVLYLQQVYHGSIIVGLSADDASHNLARALPTLAQIGADVSDVQFRGSFAFVAQKGFPAKTVLRKALTSEESVKNQPHLNVTITGAICCINSAHTSAKLLWT